MREPAKQIIYIGTLALFLLLGSPVQGWSTDDDAAATGESSPENASGDLLDDSPEALPEFLETSHLPGGEMQPELDISFFYRLTGRPDPFMPFIELTTRTPSPAAADDDEAGEEVLTGLRRFEPGQLTLTAIYVSDRGNMAMAEDSTGRGHFVRPGDYIGRRGQVERITPGRVIIREPTVSPTGETEYRTTEMILTQEGD